MSIAFLSHIREIDDPRIPGMTTYPLEEILLTVLTGLLCRCEDWDEIEELGRLEIDWLRQFLAFEHGIAPAQTIRRVFCWLDSRALEQAFAAWAADLQSAVSGVVALDGKTLCGAQWRGQQAGRMHILSAYAHEAGLVMGQRAVEARSNEITAIPELLSSLALQGAIVTIDAMGCQKDVARQIVDCDADYMLALKGNQGALHADVADYFADDRLAKESYTTSTTEAGHGRIEERICRCVDAGWLAERHPEWAGLAGIAEITAHRTNKRTGHTSSKTRYYITSLPPDPEKLLAASRAHWSIENNLHWQLDVTFREDDNRTRTDQAPQNLAIMRRIVLNIIKRDNSKRPLKRKRLIAGMDRQYREHILSC